MKKIFLLCALVFAACAGGPAPKNTVFEFIDAVKNSDSLKVAKILDVDAYIKSLIAAPATAQDTAQILEQNRPKVLESLLGEGDVRTRWLHDLIVVNKEEIYGDTATVEVSFVDQQAGTQLYTRIVLRRQPDRTWRVTYFK